MTELEQKLFKGMPPEDKADIQMKEILIETRIDRELQALNQVLCEELELPADKSPLNKEKTEELRNMLYEWYSADRVFYSDNQKSFLKKLRKENIEEYLNRRDDVITETEDIYSEYAEKITSMLGDKKIDLFRDMKKPET